MESGKRFAALAAAFMLVALPVVAQQNTLTRVLFAGSVNDTTAVGMADSTGIIYTGQYDHLYLDLKPSRPCRLAILVKSHGDSLGPSGAVALQDTSKSFVWPWRTMSTAVNTDSLAYREANLPTAVQAGSEELILEFAADGVKKWSPPRGRVFPLRSPYDGTWYWSRYTTIRYRVLTAGGVVTMKAVLRGVAW